MSTYHPGKVWSICQYVDGHCDLDLWPIDLKINNDHLQPERNVCQIWQTQVNSESSYHPEKVWFICQHVEGHCDLDLWSIGLKINRDHLHSNTNVCAKFEESRSIVGLVIIQTKFGLYQYVDGHCDLDHYAIHLKSIGIIYTPRRMSLPNLRNLGQFCV